MQYKRDTSLCPTSCALPDCRMFRRFFVSSVISNQNTVLKNRFVSPTLHLAKQTQKGFMATMAQSENTGAKPMSDYEKFIFDLNGYIILRNVLSAEEVESMNKAVDCHKDEVRARTEAALKNTKSNTSLSASGSRQDLGGMLGWESPHGDMFRRLLAHPKVSPYLVALCGEGYRLDHQPLVLLQNKNSEGFSLHGGPLSGHDGVPEGRFNPELQYHCRNGSIWNSLLAMEVCLSDAGEGDGGFCVVKGSHKLNFSVPTAFANGQVEGFEEHVHQPAVKAGDIVFFSEATVHGAMAWKADHERRLALYRFSPSNFAYGRAYLNQFGDNVINQCTPQQAAVLAPPYAVRLQRPCVTEEGENGELKQYKRSPEKMAHDIAGFGSEYF